MKGAVFVEELSEIKGKGAFAVRDWNALRRGGGMAPKPNEIKEYLQGSSGIKLTREELTERIQAYFNECIERFVDSDTGQEGYAWKTCPTKAGLAMRIGVSSFTLSRYLRSRSGGGSGYDVNMPGHRGIVDPNDFDLVELATTLIESFYEQNLGKNMNNAGSIFWLKNRTNVQWHDEQDLNLTANTGRNGPHLTREQIMAQYQALNEPPEGLELD